MLAWFLCGCKTDRKTKELVCLFATWVASYMLNSLVAYADQIETKGKRIWYGEVFAALPDQFNTDQLREAMIAVGITSQSKKVIFYWTNENHIIEKIGKGLYRKVKAVK